MSAVAAVGCTASPACTPAAAPAHGAPSQDKSSDAEPRLGPVLQSPPWGEEEVQCGAVKRKAEKDENIPDSLGTASCEGCFQLTNSVSSSLIVSALLV